MFWLKSIAIVLTFGSNISPNTSWWGNLPHNDHQLSAQNNYKIIFFCRFSNVVKLGMESFYRNMSHMILRLGIPQIGTKSLLMTEMKFKEEESQTAPVSMGCCGERQMHAVPFDLSTILNYTPPPPFPPPRP